MEKNERLEKEVQGLLTTLRELERENIALRDRSSRCENMLVSSLRPRQIGD
jgi:FtsZ-binding cell division protein ZapB